MDGKSGVSDDLEEISIGALLTMAAINKRLPIEVNPEDVFLFSEPEQRMLSRAAVKAGYTAIYNADHQLVKLEPPA